MLVSRLARPCVRGTRARSRGHAVVRSGGDCVRAEQPAKLDARETARAVPTVTRPARARTARAQQRGRDGARLACSVSNAQRSAGAQAGAARALRRPSRGRPGRARDIPPVRKLYGTGIIL